MVKLKYIFANALPEKHFVPAHIHNCFELNYYFSGSGRNVYEENSQRAAGDIDFNVTIKNGDKFLDFSANSYVLLPPYVTHDELHYGRGEVLALGFFVDDEFAKLLRALSPRVHSDAYLELQPIMKRIRDEYSTQKLYHHAVCEAFLQAALIDVLRKNNERGNAADFSYVIAYIDEYYMVPLNLERLAKSYGYSVSRFRQLFKQQAGQSPKQYILSCRLAQAKRLLSCADLPLSAVAESCGFSDYYQFSTFFKTATGKSPTQYRLCPEPH
ncbi:MAG: helix-turn-helix transcriptional regulator [Clostridiales bacterium]|jgi:AraC family transcriptional activator of pobA|nr:helix-turn-helix transcriptional regulator [Clostridiales bacterium]